MGPVCFGIRDRIMHHLQESHVDIHGNGTDMIITSQASLQALGRDLEGQVEKALQKLSEALPQFGGGQGGEGSQSGLSTALRNFTSSLEGGSPGIDQTRDRAVGGNFLQIRFSVSQVPCQMFGQAKENVLEPHVNFYSCLSSMWQS